MERRKPKPAVGMFRIEPGQLIEYLEWAKTSFKDQTLREPTVLFVRPEHLNEEVEEGETLRGMRVVSMKAPLQENYIAIAENESDFMEV